jgi:hypothetical protein
MRRNRRPPSHRPAAEQFDLFGPPRAMRSPGLMWEQLPEEARETVTRLMARLLVAHARGDRGPGKAGGRHDV